MREGGGEGGEREEKEGGEEGEVGLEKRVERGG